MTLHFVVNLTEILKSKFELTVVIPARRAIAQAFLLKHCSLMSLGVLISLKAGRLALS